jgi:hypothetical protein
VTTTASSTAAICSTIAKAACVALAIGLLAHEAAHAAYTEPRLAVTRATPYRPANGRITLKIEGTFSFADTIQLALPLTITVTQGSLRARFDLAGNVFTSTGGGVEQLAAGPGMLSAGPREITIVLPNGFSAGAAVVQAVLTYEGKPINSNALTVAL